PMATDYRIEIPAGTTSESGGELAQTVAWEFSTPPVGVESFYPQSESLPLDPVFLLVFNQRIDPQAVLDTVIFGGGGADRSIRLATGDEVAADENISGLVDGLLEGRWLAFKATDALESDTGYSIVVGPGTPSEEGPRLTTQPEAFNVRTYAPLRIEESSCRSSDRCEPGWDLWIRFNNLLDIEAFDPSMVSIEPDLPGMAVFAEYNSVRIYGSVVGGTTYEATLSADLEDVHGQLLGEDEVVEFHIDDARPQLNEFGDHLITLDPLAPSPSLGVTSVNHDKLRVRLFRVDADDWVTYVKYWEARWDDQNPPPLPDWDEVSDREVDTRSRPNELTETTINLGDVLDGDPGHIVVLVEPTGRLADLSRESNDYW
ncbi:MAG: Ig-like domain-containing protein, partial [Actinomycetia bacterium]|nr:Ig-like domain-containing protein [Actinomycetes bacterium]